MFLKAPTPGRVKTRLGRRIGFQKAAELYRAFVKDTLAWVAALPRCDRVVRFTPSDADPASLTALCPSGRRAFRFLPQARGGLGLRLASAFEDCFRSGHSPVLAIGTDSPLLLPAHIGLAFRALGRHDLVLGPAADGGYYLVGMNRPRREIFQGIPWSTGQVRQETLDRAQQAGLSVHELPPLLDVDDEADLEALHRDLLRAWARWESGPFPIWTLRTVSLELPPAAMKARSAQPFPFCACEG